MSAILHVQGNKLSMQNVGNALQVISEKNYLCELRHVQSRVRKQYGNAVVACAICSWKLWQENLEI